MVRIFLFPRQGLHIEFLCTKSFLFADLRQMDSLLPSRNTNRMQLCLSRIVINGKEAYTNNWEKIHHATNYSIFEALRDFHYYDPGFLFAIRSTTRSRKTTHAEAHHNAKKGMATSAGNENTSVWKQERLSKKTEGNQGGSQWHPRAQCRAIPKSRQPTHDQRTGIQFRSPGEPESKP